jgi:hypothetical protein
VTVQAVTRFGPPSPGEVSAWAGRTPPATTSAETSFPAPSGLTDASRAVTPSVASVRDDEQAGVSPERIRPARNLNQAPLRVITHREVMASRTRLYLECGHGVERAYTGWAHRARCEECLAEGRS